MEAGKEALRESAARQAREEQAEAAARREANNKNFYQLGDRSYSYVGRDAMANWMSKTNN